MARHAGLLIACIAASMTTASAQLPFAHRPEKNPYRNLMRNESAPGQASGAIRRPQPASRADAKPPMVVCGTLIVPVDAELDSKMMVKPPQTEAQYTMRVIVPPLCRAPDPNPQR